MVEEAGLSQAIEASSAGTHAYHVGEGADLRSARSALRRGYDLSAHRARRVEVRDFDEFDYVLAMDDENLRHLEASGGSGQTDRGRTRRARVRPLLDFAPSAAFSEVPDPYSRGEEGFELVLDLIETACAGLLEHVRRTDLDEETSTSDESSSRP